MDELEGRWEAVCKLSVSKQDRLEAALQQVVLTDNRWWNVSKYIYSSTVIKYKFEVFLLYLSISISCSFILLLHYKYCSFYSTTFV